jgi:glycosyltransferase 2 family protein
LKKRLLVWFGIILSAVFLYIALHDIDFAQFADTLAGADGTRIAVAFVFLLLVYVVRTLRWQIIISTKARIAFWSTFVVQMVGFFCNNVLPARAGEIIRAFLLRRHVDVSRSFALGTIVVERVSDVAALLILLLVALMRIPADRLPAETAWIRLMAATVLVGFIGGMSLLVWARAWTIDIIRRILGIVLSESVASGIADRLDHLGQGFDVLRKPAKLALVFGFALLDWTLIVCVFHFVFAALHMDAPLSAALFSVALVHLGMLVPSSPGYVGTYEFFIKKSLAVFAIPASQAIAAALLIRMQWYLFETIVGFAMLGVSQVSVKELSRITNDEDTADGGETEGTDPG